LRVAVVSDIHANLHALEAVLEAIDADPPDELWCLGDLVGYGPRPNEVVEIVRERARICLVGNHDLGVLDRIDLDEFTPDAAAVARWTRTVLLDDTRVFLEGLEPEARAQGAELYHASPRDPIWEYVLSTLQAELCLAEPGGGRWAHGRRQVDLVLLLRPERRADHRALDADRIFARFWGPQAQFAAFDPEANLPKVVAPVFTRRQSRSRRCVCLAQGSTSTSNRTLIGEPHATLTHAKKPPLNGATFEMTIWA